MKLMIKDVATVQIGYQARGRIEPNPAGAFQIIQAKDVDDDHELISDSIFRVDVARDAEKYKLNAGDILFLSRGQTNYATVVREALQNTIATNTFYILRVNSGNILPDYLAWYLNQAQEQLKTIAQAQNIPLIPKAAFELMEIDVPAVSVQAAIAKLNMLLRRERNLIKTREHLVQKVCAQAARQ